MEISGPSNTNTFYGSTTVSDYEVNLEDESLLRHSPPQPPLTPSRVKPSLRKNAITASLSAISLDTMAASNIHHHNTGLTMAASSIHHHNTNTGLTERQPIKKQISDVSTEESSTTSSIYDKNGHTTEKYRLRRLAVDLSLYINLMILLTKIYAYWRTLSLSVLAALVDSVLDVISQLVLSYTEKRSEVVHGRSSAIYPAGASRLEPVGVLTCAALMGMASFEVIKESVEALVYGTDEIEEEHLTSVVSMVCIVVIKIGLLMLCQKAGERRTVAQMRGGVAGMNSGRSVIVKIDPTLDALAQDHLNDALSNAVAAFALLCTITSPKLWPIDPIGAILISVYIIYSWYATGREQIEQLTGKVAPQDFIDELTYIASNHNPDMLVDVCRAYHFGPKFLVELEVVLPRDTLLFDSHDIGMDLQYEIESREEVERCFVHIDYEKREYDEHVVSKVPELMELHRPKGWEIGKATSV
mmetsp:Transcript_18830/g.23156  ORF Transcript_18830/g.23156 Transcript_18830/m.23156 type:complete len:471 (-) Transcript_18830:454-1866(-)